jgi:hypothetical protein
MWEPVGRTRHMDSTKPDGRIDGVKERLSRDLVDDRGNPVDPDAVTKVVDDARAQFTDAPVQEFVPLLVEHTARDELRQAGLHRQLDEPDDEPVHTDHDHDASAGPTLSAQQGIPPT